MKFIKKYYFLIVIIILSIYRFILSYNLKSFYIYNFICDDKLMINMLNSMLDGNYLGVYNQWTIIKGISFPLLLYITNILKFSYSVMFTLIHIGTCVYFVLSLKEIIKNKYILGILYLLLLFNPVSYSSELFQRLYRNALSIPELLLFLGTIIRIIKLKNYSIKTIMYYILLGIICSIMYLTREDHIWVVLGLFILFIYKIYNNHKIKTILINIIPIVVVIICLNICSLINYNHYNIYTYNELSKSEFKNAYLKILQIKDDEKKEKVAIPKNTLIKLAKNSKTFKITEEDIEELYRSLYRHADEISNSNIIWKFRNLIYDKFNFKNGEEANKYFHDLSEELDELFEKGIFEKELNFPSIFINPPTIKDIKKMPKSFIEIITYTSSYEDIKTIPRSFFEKKKYDNKVNAYKIAFYSSHKTAHIVDENPIIYEIIRIIYKYFTIIVSIPCLIIYLYNIRKKDILNIILHIIVSTYLLIIGGVVYTHVTAFDSIRYCYLGNIYILQNIFIILNIYRFYDNKKDNIFKRKKKLNNIK